MTLELWALTSNAVQLSLPLSFYCWSGTLLCPHGDTQKKHYALMDFSAHGGQTEPNPVFVACFSCEL